MAVLTLGINLFGKRTVQADSCLHSEQIDTLFVCAFGGSGRGPWGVGGTPSKPKQAVRHNVWQRQIMRGQLVY